MYQNKIPLLYNNLKKNNYGFGFFINNLFMSRIEFFSKNNTLISPIQKLILNDLILKFKINKHSFKTKHLINIYVLSLLGTYKGWRHSRGLPVRGQRTWSNAWSSYRSNLILRSYKIVLSKKMYGQHFSNDSFVAYVAEEVNNMWRLQWGNEWLIARKKRIASSKNIKNDSKIDILSMSKLQVGSFTKNDKQKTKNKKQKNTQTLGFDPGFTKLLLKKTKTQTKTKKSK